MSFVPPVGYSKNRINAPPLSSPFYACSAGIFLRLRLTENTWFLECLRFHHGTPRENRMNIYIDKTVYQFEVGSA